MENTKKGPGRPPHNAHPTTCSGEPIPYEEIERKRAEAEDRKRKKQTQRQKCPNESGYGCGQGLNGSDASTCNENNHTDDKYQNSISGGSSSCENSKDRTKTRKDSSCSIKSLRKWSC